MTEITNEDIALLGLFAGKTQDIDKIQRQRGYINFDVYIDAETSSAIHWRSIEESVFDEIKDVFIGPLRFRPYYAEQMLLALWIREDKFAMGALKKDDILDFIQDSFDFNCIEVEDATVMEELGALFGDEYLQRPIVDEDWTQDYSLTSKGKRVAGEMFEMLKPLVSDRIEFSPTGPKVENVANSESIPQLANVNIKNLGELEKVIFDSAYRAMARFQEPLDEVSIEKIHRLRCDNVEWKFIGRTIYREEHGADIDEKDLEKYTDSLRKQHRRQYPNFYDTEK